MENSSLALYPYLPLSPFVEHLRGQGFVIGVEILQQMQVLIRVLDIQEGDDYTLLKTSLCPLFATNKEQQEEFYKAFDKFFVPKASPGGNQKFSSGDDDDFDINDKRKNKGASSFVWLSAILGFILLGLVGFWLFNLSQESHFDIKLASMKPDSVHTPHFGAGPQINNQPKAPAKAAPDGTPLNHHEPYTPMISPDISYFKMSYAEQFRFPIIFFGLGGLIVLGIFYTGSELYNWQRRRLVLKRRKELDPISAWPVNAEERIHIYLPEDYAIASALLQKRLTRSYEGINIPATVVKTARNGGLLTLEYHQHSRPPEYLLLVDIKAVKNLQFDFYNYLFRSFIAQGIRVSTFYFEGDPRVCFNTDKKGNVSLSYLIYHYGGCRLMILSDGDGLLDAQNEENNSWMGLFRNWHDKALLSTRPINQWDDKENALSQHWTLVPASLPGLSEMVHAFEKGGIKDPENWLDTAGDDLSTLSWEPETLIEDLKQYFADDTHPPLMIQWLAACCIYPELYWDLVLFTGRQLSTLSNPLNQLERIHKLVSLPWFAQSRIPDAYRKVLLEDTSILPVETREALSLLIAELLRNNLPEDHKSMAYYRRRMFIISLELTGQKKMSDTRKKNLLTELKKLQELSGEEEYSIIQQLNHNLAANLNAVVPKIVQQYLFRGGMVYQGFKTGVKAALFVVLAAIVFTRLDFASLYGDEAHHEGESYLIDNFEKDASYNTLWAAINYNDGDIHVNPESNGYHLADIYLGQAITAKKDYAPAIINEYIAEYNNGKLLYNFGEPKQALALWDHAKKRYWSDIEQSLRVGSAAGMHQYSNFRDAFENLKKEYKVLYARAEKE